MTIEGIPHGWELVRVGTPIKGVDWIVNADKQAAPCNFETTLMNWVIIRKKPKQYRAFANAAEILADIEIVADRPKPDRIVRYSDV